jgi:RimJ/RimL family protein N-acetyltransferase
MAILVRPITPEDIDSFRETLDQVARERRYLALLEAPPLEQVTAFVRDCIEQHGAHFVAVESSEVIGWCDIHRRKEPGFTHIGRLGMGVLAKFRGQGIGRKLLTATVEKALSEGLARIELEYFSPNLPAARLYQSVGFVQEGVSIDGRFLDGQWTDVVRMALRPGESKDRRQELLESAKDANARRQTGEQLTEASGGAQSAQPSCGVVRDSRPGTATVLRGFLSSAKDADARRQTGEELKEASGGARSAQPSCGVVRDSRPGTATVLRGFLSRIERDAGIPGLADTLAGLPPTDLQSLMLAVYEMAAARRHPSDLLAHYAKNRFVRPGKTAPSELLRWEALAVSRLPPAFEAIELAPTCPLGTNSVVAAVDQNWAVSTARNTEVVSDPTNVLALQCALRRRGLSKQTRRSQSVHLAARHRVVRAQRYRDSNAPSHFSLFGLASGGRDQGSRGFEISHLMTHCRFYLTALREFLGAERTLIVTLTDFGAADDRIRLERDIVIPLCQSFGEQAARINNQRPSGRGYYRDLCFKIHAESQSGEMVEVADGGSVDWLAKLLSDRKERLVISGIGSERVCGLAS